MKLILKKPGTEDAFKKLNISKREAPCFDVAWHYHPKFELIYITKSNGLRFVGDNVSPFYPGDLVLVGSYLPHLWRNDSSYYEDDSVKEVETIITKFDLDFLGNDIFNLPDFVDIKKLLDKSKFGVFFGENVSKDLHTKLVNLPKLSYVEQHIEVLSILQKLSQAEETTILSSSDMSQSTTESSERIDTVLRYISDNYATNIDLNDISDIACMTTNSFCRFFKKATNKSFTQFLNEVRIRNASRLLVQDDISVSTVCYAVGYNSITNFNKQFKQIMGVTPKVFREEI
ncbi:hypothetical protein AXE80_10170 [Wenyingzhuangia fucanilytica]|uniref:HTH araC/xylS-type domain-containing protein n=1 Tax=Wenyingzhuangia fucanilytica TaxID=1790137 RepID=A0A1B1Y799_9FLAO|nr:AraC family transcriptional regulator [Wenyingzhuangia fucanilytica]ANW96619.1 hypothetical protein AXE80_10170 [Wenyingzhuangia fucanilytica]